MNKKLNTFLFIIGGIILNVLIFLTLFMLPLLIIILLFRNFIDGNGFSFIILGLIIGSIIGTIIIYNWIIKKLSHKIDMRKYFSPLFRKGE